MTEDTDSLFLTFWLIVTSIHIVYVFKCLTIE